MNAALSNSGIPQDQVKVLADIYRNAAAKLRGIILGPPGKTAYTQEWQVTWASQRLAQVEKEINRLKREAVDWVSDGRDGSPGPVMEAMFDGLNRAHRQAADAGVESTGSLMAGRFTLIDRRTVEVFAKEISADLTKAADGMGKTAKLILTRTRQQGLSEAEIHKILAGGVISGKPVQTIRELRKALKDVHGDTVTIIDKNGDAMHFKAGYYASLVARTKTREACEHARHQRLSDLGLDLVRVIGRVSKNFCTAYLGMVFSISGRSKKYPPLRSLPQHGPPMHPQCSKSTAPYIEELASGKQAENAEGLEDAHKLLNVSGTEAQRRFDSLQIHTQIKDRYGTKADQLFTERGARIKRPSTAVRNDEPVTMFKSPPRPPGEALPPRSSKK